MTEIDCLFERIMEKIRGCDDSDENGEWVLQSILNAINSYFAQQSLSGSADATPKSCRNCNTDWCGNSRKSLYCCEDWTPRA